MGMRAPGLWIAACALWLGTGVMAQDVRVQSPVLVLESDQMYLSSAFGRRIAAEVASENEALGAENRRIEAALEEEEQSLTEQRPSLEPDAFRDLADAFDVKVRTIRAEQELKARRIASKQDDARRGFLRSAAPILETMMIESGAAVILERRQVFLSRNAVDITREAVARIDAEIGDGTEIDAPEPSREPQE